MPGRDELAIALAMRRGEQPGAARRSDHDQFGPQRADAALVCDEGGDLSVAELVQNPGAEGAWAKIIEGVLGEPAAQRAAQVSVDVVERLARAAAMRCHKSG